MNRRLPILIAILAVLGGGTVASLAWADGSAKDEIAHGFRIGGVDVGGLTRGAALERLRARIGQPARRPATVQVGERTFTLTAERAGLELRLGAAVNRAHAASRDGHLLERGWRKLTGSSIDRDEPVPIGVDRAAVRSFVGDIHAQLARSPVDASIDLQVDSVSISPSRPGRRLAGREDLVTRIVEGMRAPRGDRSHRARMVPVPPKVTEEGLWDAQPVAVTVSRASTTARVFRRGKLERTYNVAVGEPNYPTPVGRFVVQTKQVNPPWNVPNSEWAGELAGQTIPGGDPRNPLKARWVGFNGAVGFHGTASIGSLGSAASHGCVRMSVGDVIDLYERVSVGTPVLVA